MNEFAIALGFAALPPFSNFVGGLLAEILPTSKRMLGLALHASIGVLLAIVSVELIPRIIEAKPVWIAILAFFAGGAFFIVTNQSLARLQKRVNHTKGNSIAWTIYLSIFIDLFNDGLTIGTSVTISRHLGLILAIARGIAHIPEGFSTVAEFKRQKTSRHFRLLLSLSFFLPILLGATLGYLILRGQPDIAKLGVLAFTTGILTTAIVEEIIPEAHQQQDTYLSNLVFVGSFALFTLFLTSVA